MNRKVPKTIHNLPKNDSPSRPLEPMCWTRDRFHGQSPFTNQLQRTSVDDSHPQPTGDRVLAPSSTNISSPLVSHGHNDRDTHPPSATATCVRVMGKDNPPTGPSPGANPPIYPSSLPLASGEMLPNSSPNTRMIDQFSNVRCPRFPLSHDLSR